MTGESQMDQLLTLYKTVATIRDVKETYFYISITANQLSTNPLIYNYPLGTNFVDGTLTPITLSEQPPYFAPIDTKRTFTIGNQINSLLDLRVPKDKYMVQIQMVEGLIEADSSNWVKSLNLGDTRVPNGDVVVYPLYDLDYLDQPDPTGTFTPTDPIPKINTATPVYRTARKKSIPSPLYCRIRELNDTNEPYQWSVSNDGQVSLDKSHGIITRFGDVHYSQLTLEFGHLVWIGRDNQYRDFGLKTISRSGSAEDIARWTAVDVPPDRGNPRATRSIADYGDYAYLDYNREWSNSMSVDAVQNMANVQFTEPATRGVAFTVDDQKIKPSLPTPVETRLASLPIKTNQQASSIVFRFSVKLIHMF